LLHQAGAKIVAVSDVDGGIHNENGLDVPSLFTHAYLQRKPVGDFANGDPITNDQIWKIPCEWLVPAALGGVISKEGAAETIECKVVVEAANSPTTPIGEKILAERGIPVLPDMLVNAGGVVVSYFEWTQNLQQHPWTLERVNRGLHAKMQTAYRSVREIVNAKNVSWRIAALAIALERVAEAERLRAGW